MNDVVNNVFQNSAEVARPSGAMVEVESGRAVAETKAAMLLAKQFPRDQVQAVDRILASCARPSLAEAALYQYAKGGTDVTGPSIRLAEAIAQSWGNVQFGIRELEQVPGRSTVEAFAWDVETNTRQVKIFQVDHVRHTKKGVFKLNDPRDVYELVANQGARRLRACILGIIPGDVVDSAVRQCEVTLRSKVEVTPELIKSLVEKFAAYGVTKEQLEKRIQRRLDETVSPALIVQLGKVYNSLRDGMSSVGDWFEVAPAVDDKAAGKGSASLKDRVAAATGNKGAEQ